MQVCCLSVREGVGTSGALTRLVLLAIPGVPGAHELAGVLGVGVDGGQDVLAGEGAGTPAC